MSYYANIRKWYDRATLDHRHEGSNWYPSARAEIAGLATKHGLPFNTAAGVFAALSPRISWQENTEGARKMIEAYAHGWEQPIVAGTSTNRTKAWRILTMGSAILSGPKVTSFYQNLIGNDEAVTVDTWAARAAGITDNLQLSHVSRIYNKVARAYRRLARKLGYRPSELQAIVWVTIRSTKGEMPA